MNFMAIEGGGEGKRKKSPNKRGTAFLSLWNATLTSTARKMREIPKESCD